MDVFKIDQSLGGLGSVPTDSGKVTTEVTFDTNSDFNLSFFESSTPPTPPVGLSKDGKFAYDDNTSPHSCHDAVFDPLGSEGFFSPPPVTPPSPNSTRASLNEGDTGSKLRIKGSHGGNHLLPPLSILPPPHHGSPKTPPATPQTPTGSILVKSEQSFSSSDSGSSSGSKSFVPCKVCGDKASGYHYGVTSCEGCKGFFRRSIQKQIEYRCLRDGKCLVIRLNRNRCQYCRFKKCLAVGMSRDSVRYGRVPKRSRERGGSIAGDENIRSPGFADPSTSDSSDSLPSSLNARDPESRQLALYDTILTVSQAYHAHCAYTEEKTRGIIRGPMNVNVEEVEKSSNLTNEDVLRIATWSAFASHITPSIQRVVEFAKRVPGFPELSQDDQLILIKIGFIEVWLGHVTRLINSSDKTLTFADGATVTSQQMELMFDADFSKSIFDFAESLNGLTINDSEMALFSAVVLLCPERSALSDPKTVSQHQERVTEALKLQLLRNHASDPNLINTVMQKVNELRSLGCRHHGQLDWYRHRWRAAVNLPPLFAEMFDIARNEEEIA